MRGCDDTEIKATTSVSTEPPVYVAESTMCAQEEVDDTVLAQ